MSGPNVTLRRAAPDALPYVEALLEESGLPAGDVRSSPAVFYTAHVREARVGTGGIEPCGDAGLLRSVVVERSARGEGVGTALCDALEATAETRGIDTLYLLTTTAADFFADRGYVEVDRTDPPPSIRQTAQFEDLCPATATPMRKSLRE